MNKSDTYRSVAAFFLAALIVQVFVLKGLHECAGHCISQEDTSVACSFKGAHLSAEKHVKSACNICLFHFAPTDFCTEVLAVKVPEYIANKSQFICQQNQLNRKIRQAYLRGPPCAIA